MSDKQEQAVFEAAFAGDDTPADTQEVVAEVERQSEVDQAGEQDPDTTPASDAVPQGEAEAAEEDPVLLDGLTRSELRRLLGNAADVDSLRRQLDKAHGHIGDLNRKVQQAFTAKPAGDLPPELKQFENDYPEFAQYARALAGGARVVPQQDQPTQQAAAPQAQYEPEQVQQPQQAQQAQSDQQGLDPLVLEMAVLDRIHDGWRNTVQSQDFGLWLSAQGQDKQQAYESATTAGEISGLLGEFDQWAQARNSVTERAAKGQQRLQRAVTPSGGVQRPSAALSDQEIFEAAFRS